MILVLKLVAYLINSSLIWSFLLEGGTENNNQREHMRSWAPTIYYRLGKEVYNFLGREITIQESIDSYGATIWPAVRLSTAEAMNHERQMHM